MDWLVYFDLFGVFVFALSGGLDGAKYRLDMFGIMVLAVATGVGGGIMRDALLGVHPPAAFVHEVYLLVCLGAGLVSFFFAKRIELHFIYVRIADAIGLGVFSAIGASVAVDHGLGWVGVILISILTATGGGVIRDLLVREIPLILRADFYASNAVFGAFTFLILHSYGVSQELTLLCSAFVATVSRFMAMHFNFSLPTARHGNKKES